jgi:hypothetical protein
LGCFDEILCIGPARVFHPPMSPQSDPSFLSRRQMIRNLGVTGAVLALSPWMQGKSESSSGPDSKPLQLYKSLSEEQRKKICLPVDHERRQYVSNWWYVHDEHRIHNTFNSEQQDLIRQIFDSMHDAEFRDAVSRQVEKDKFGKIGNTPSVGFFGTPEDRDFEFIYTGHHVTRRCNGHSDQGQGFGGAPIFYGHFDKKFNETKDHVGNPYWYQGKIFNEFVQALSGAQQEKALAGVQPRSEKPAAVIRKKAGDWVGLCGADLSPDQKAKLLTTMRKMMAMFRKGDIDATMRTIQDKGMIDRLFVSYYDGKYDLGNDKVWDTWQIEGPDMVWYFRGQPHIHTYFHVKA